uniref:Uncharacterized protein n=1 Tax=Cryptomonas curvata TaxID=233186 RepID=A0A7S0QN76_9CRYP
MMANWKSGLCRVCADPGGSSICCMAFFCPCVVFGRNMGTLSSKECMCGGEAQIATLAHLVTLFTLPIAGTFMQCFGRSAIRKKYQIPGDDCSDFACSCLCGCCTLIQEYNQIHGSIGASASGRRFGAAMTDVETSNTMDPRPE